MSARRDLVPATFAAYADRSPELDYIATVYNGLNTNEFEFNETPDDYLIYFGRIHHDKGTAEAIDIAQSTTGSRLVLR